MEKWECMPCGYIYDSSEGDDTSGITPGTSFEDLPSDWFCPICYANKEEFAKME